MGLLLVVLLPQLAAGSTDAGAPSTAWVAPVAADDVSTDGPITGRAVATALDQHGRELRRCYEAELAKNPRLALKVHLEWTIGARGDVRIEPAGRVRLEQCLLTSIAPLRFAAADRETRVGASLIFNSVGNWMADPVVRAVREAVAKIDAAADGGSPQRTCRLYLMTGATGGTIFIAAQREETGASKRLVLEEDAQGLTDDYTQTTTLTEYAGGDGGLLFRFREVTMTRGMAPTHSEERAYFAGGQPYLSACRSGPTGSRVWFDEAASREPLHLPTVEARWAPYGGTSDGLCAELRRISSAARGGLGAMDHARLKKRFGRLVVLGEPP